MRLHSDKNWLAHTFPIDWVNSPLHIFVWQILHEFGAVCDIIGEASGRTSMSRTALRQVLCLT